jgi:hypothetical protein
MINRVAGDRYYVWHSQNANACLVAAVQRLIGAILEINWSISRLLPIDYASGTKVRGAS